MTASNVATIERNPPMAQVGMAREGSGSRIAPQNLGEVVKFAEVMSRADIALPKHLRGNPGACMAVALQALDWQMNPFAVASKSYSVNNIIAYEAQLIAAVVNTRSGIKGRLRYDYEGEGATLTCTVTGTLDGTECTYQSPPMGAITTKNSPLWKTDPRQQLGYYSARSWARRHCPEVILGVYDRDEAEEIKDVTPPTGTGLAARLQGGEGGFNAATIESALAGSQEGENADPGAEQPDGPEQPPTGTVGDPDAAIDPVGACINSMQTAHTLEAVKAAFAAGWGAITDEDGRASIKTAYDTRKAEMTPPPADDDFPGDAPFESEGAAQ